MKRNALVLSIFAAVLALVVAGGLAPSSAVQAGEGAIQAAPPVVIAEQKPPVVALPMPEADKPPAGEVPLPFPTAATTSPLGAASSNAASPNAASPNAALGVARPRAIEVPAAAPSPGTARAGTVDQMGLPAGWQGHRPGEVVWSSEWGTSAPARAVAPRSGAVSEGVVRAPRGWPSDVPTDGLPGPEDTSMPAGDMAADMPADMPDRGRVQTERRSFLVASYIEKARESLRLADVDGARDLLTKALDLDPMNAEARELWQMVSLDRASTAGSYGGSRKDVADVTRERAATEVRNHLRRGQQNEASERYDEAVREYRKGLAIISWYDQTADFGTSADNIRDLIDAAESKARVSARRARQDAIQRAQAERESEMVQAREQRLGRIRAWFDGAHRAFRRGEYALAREFARQILRADPTNRDAERIIEMSHDAEHSDNDVESRREFGNQWKSIMMDLEESALPQVDTVVFPENWLDDIAQRRPRAIGDPIDTEEASDVVAIQSVLDKKRVQGLTWEEANLNTVVGYLRTITGLNFHVTPKVVEEKGEDVSVNLNVSDVSITTILDLITSQFDLAWAPRGGVVTIMTKDEVRGAMKLRYFDVRDLAVQVRDFATEDLNLVPSNFTPPEPPELPDPEPIYSADSLVELIQNTIGNEETWSESAPVQQNNILIIRNTPEILAQVDDLLNQLRASTGVLVNLEVRFLTAEDNFLRDVGVDVRGLGSGVAPVTTNGQGPQVVMDDVFFGSAANPFGVPFGTNPEPSSVGTGNDAGIFYNDGQDGAYSARVENLFDTVVSRFGNPEVLTNSGGVSFQHTFLDDTAVEVILRAVEKSQRVQQITAPRITVYNTQRANVSVLNQISYVQDYEVEIAQASNIANPVIQTIQEGVVLDVRPIVSSDRRFVTLELRPNVAEVLRPIGEFTTNLAAGPIGANAPVTLQIPELRVQRVRTTVMMPDGGTLLLGGMKFYEKDIRESGVPLLSKIPILSFLLTRKGNFVNRRNLLILVTARIVPLEELEPRDNLVLPPEPERTWRPIRDIDPTCGPCANGACDVPAAPQACSTCKKPACTTCRAR